MRITANIFLIAILLLTSYSFGQKNRIFTNLEETLLVSPDSIYRLDLSKKKLNTLPEEIKKFKNLQELNLSKNKLTDLPNWFLFEDLRILNLSKNKIITFPSEIMKNTNLRHLFLGKNTLSEIPETIDKLQNLIILDLWYNPITDLPESLVNLRNLRSLDLSGLNFDKNFQKKWNSLLPWVKIEFEAACNCAN